MQKKNMISIGSRQPVFRFAPSPNGALHLGHAFSAILNSNMAKETDGRFLLRIEDIDVARCRAEFESAIFTDLTWLGLDWEKPVRRQSEHFPLYRDMLGRLVKLGLAYPAFLTRGDVKARMEEQERSGGLWPRDPDGSPLYPQDERHLSTALRQRLLEEKPRHAWRLDMEKALAMAGSRLSWRESGMGPDGQTGLVAANPAAWGDVVLSRSDAPSSYHLCVVVDDALQGVTHVVRGQDLFHATSLHRLLQVLLDLPEPRYHHHRLIMGTDGRKLSKSGHDTGIAAFRAAGRTPEDIRALIGL